MWIGIRHTENSKLSAKQNNPIIHNQMAKIFVGIDIQIRRDCCYAIIGNTGILIDSGWFSSIEFDAVDLLKQWSKSGQIYVGIDAPRMPLVSKRQWYWSSAKRKWFPRKAQKGNGRHCEFVISAHRLANPKWTPLERDAPLWMQLGFKLFSALEGHAIVYEVFPTASYACLQGNCDVRTDADFSACKPGPKDMLDAMVAAATVLEFVEGRVVEVGGGDGLGTIILPRPLP